jgi:hypothetical protein
VRGRRGWHIYSLDLGRERCRLLRRQQRRGPREASRRSQRMPTYGYGATDVSANSRSRNLREPSSCFGTERRARVRSVGINRHITHGPDDEKPCRSESALSARPRIKLHVVGVLTDDHPSFVLNTLCSSPWHWPMFCKQRCSGMCNMVCPRCDRARIERNGSRIRCAVCGMPYDPDQIITTQSREQSAADPLYQRGTSMDYRTMLTRSISLLDS